MLNLLKLLSSPASRKQAGYKKDSKKKGLLSLEQILSKAQETNSLNEKEFEALLEEAKNQNNPELITNLFSNNQTKLCLTSAVKVDLGSTEADEDGFIILTNKTIYENGKNWHNLDLPEKDLSYMVEQFNEEPKDSENRVLNSNHSRYPEDSIGEFSNLSIDEEKVNATIKIDANHPSFASQKYVLSKGDVELGFSIELTFEDVLLSLKTWEVTYKDPKLVGLATTLIPSAPGTLTKLDTTDEELEENGEEEVAEKLETKNIVLSTEVKADNVELQEMLTKLEEKLQAFEEQAKLTKLEEKLQEIEKQNKEQIDELEKSIQNRLNQVSSSNQEFIEMAIKTMENQNSTIDQQNKTIQILEKHNKLQTSISTIN